MNTKKFTVGASAFVLAIAGAFATKASNNAKFTDGFTVNGTPSSSSVSCDKFHPLLNVCLDNNGNTLYTAKTKANNSSIKTLRTLGN